MVTSSSLAELDFKDQGIPAAGTLQEPECSEVEGPERIEKEEGRMRGCYQSAQAGFCCSIKEGRWEETPFFPSVFL